MFSVMFIPVVWWCRFGNTSSSGPSSWQGSLSPCLPLWNSVCIFLDLNSCFCDYVGSVCVCVLYWKANRNMSTTLMTISNIMIMNTTTFWVSGGRLQRSMVFRNPILCLLHLPEPLPRAISLEASSSSFFSSLSSATPPLLCIRSRMKCRHHAASPPLGWSLVLSNSVTLLRCLAVLIVSSASPATLLIHRIALACQWRLGALLLAVVNLAWWS